MPYGLLQFNIIPLLRLQVHLTGADRLPQEPFIVAANHQSWLDGALVIGCLTRRLQHRLHIIAASSKYRFLGTIPIDAKFPAASIDRALTLLAQGHAVGIFPEGNANVEPHLRQPKTGVARLALRSGVPVVPIGISGLSAPTFFHSFRSFFTRWRPWRIAIGEPLSFPREEEAAITRERLHAVADDVMAAIAPLCGKPYDPS